MLLELRVENYAVIDHVIVQFAPGLNLLTGETGAGKSILIDALALLLGEKASTDIIRHGADKAVISAVFAVDDVRQGEILEQYGIDSEESEIILRREISTDGRGRVFINNQPATVAVLKRLAPLLAAVHAQNASIFGFDAAARMRLLDDFATCDSRPAAAAFATWNEIRSRIAELERGEQDKLRLIDLWSFQKKEIEAVRPQPGEDDRLEAEKRVLANAEKIYSSAMTAFDLLYEGEASAASSLRAASRQLQELARYETKFRDSIAVLESARIAAEDLAATLRDYAGAINASPERLAEIEDRLAALDRLKRKYGDSLEAVIAFGEEVARKLNEIENKDEVLRNLRSQLSVAAGKYLTVARALSRHRADAARRLEKIVEHEVNELAMKARFRVQVEGSDEENYWTTSGFDQVSYLISTNPGEPLKPVEQIASGGEMSRVMLALKATIEGGARRRKNEIQRTLIFDEIDTGIGGRAAEAVGKKLKELSATSQVLCITHLPQIACFADHHYRIEKRESAGRTRTSLRPLEDGERREELARMLSGAKVTETSLKHAEQMLKAGATR